MDLKISKRYQFNKKRYIINKINIDDMTEYAPNNIKN